MPQREANKKHDAHKENVKYMWKKKGKQRQQQQKQQQQQYWLQQKRLQRGSSVCFVDDKNVQCLVQLVRFIAIFPISVLAPPQLQTLLVTDLAK